MWNSKKFSLMLYEMKTRGEIKSKDAYYEKIAESIHVSVYTVKSWARPNSNGPSDGNVRLALEEFLGLQPGALLEDSYESKENKKMELTISDFTKDKILQCYKQMKDYLHDDEVESEDRLVEMWDKIGALRIAIPDELYNKIEIFIKENLAPIIYESDVLFAEVYKAQALKTEEGTMKSIAKYLDIMYNIEVKLDEFADKEMKPYLL